MFPMKSFLKRKYLLFQLIVMELVVTTGLNKNMGLIERLENLRDVEINLLVI